MRKQNEETKTTGVMLGAICLAALLWAFPCAAQSQDTPTPQDNPTDSQPQEPEPFPTHSVTSSLDTGSTIDTDNKIISALHVGHWSILDFDLFYAFDSNYLFQPSSPSVSNAAAARALILYSRQNGDSGIDFQYQPYLLASEEGQQRSVFLDQLLDLHVYHHLNAHWVVNVNELFRYEPDTGSLLDPTIIPNYTTGDIFQTPFFADGQQSIQNDLTASFVDTLTARDTLAFHAEYEYAYVTTAFNVPNPPLGQTFQTQNTIGGGVSWNHSWRSNQQFGINYTYARQILGSPNQEEQYQSILFSYRQKLRPTLILELGIGPSIQVHGNGSGSNETFIGNAALLQSFRRAYLTLSFSRDYGYTGVITDSYHDRYDASYSQSVGRRWILSAGIGYIQQQSLVIPQVNGRDYWGRVDYNITRRWGVFAQLMNSAAAGPQQPYASRNFLTAGLRWSSQREHEYQR